MAGSSACGFAPKLLPSLSSTTSEEKIKNTDDDGVQNNGVGIVGMNLPSVVSR